VAAGRLHAYWTFDAKPWDVAAACLIVSQAGGLVTDASGGSWLHSDGSYVAATPPAHTWAVRDLNYAREQSRQTS
jgi:myo-inositol-1(or 4)-monophosphatase